MAYPKILQRLFEHSGAGPRLRKEILPFGSTPGTVCEGNDGRLSNARVPEMHKETHQAGGADALTPEDIGAHPADGMASADKAGIARLSSAVNLDSEDQAATPKAVKVTHELAASAKADAAAAQARADSAHAEAGRMASTTSSGRVQLSSALNSDSEALAATPKAVKVTHELAASAKADAAAAHAEAGRAASTPATPDRLGVVRIGQGIGVDENGIISTEPAAINPWDIFPLRVPIAVDGVRFGGSDGRRAIMPGETDARENWVECDGGTDGKGGTVPDLRGRMIMGASSSYPAGSTGGSTTHEHSLSGSVGETTLTEAQLASHRHIVGQEGLVASGASVYATYGSSTPDRVSGIAGGSSAHTHSLNVYSGNTTNLPPYYTLSYIMRVA